MVPASSPSLTAFAVLLALLMIMISARTEASPFNAGMKRFQAGQGADRIPVLMFYPTQQQEQAINIGPFTVRVAPEADMPEGQYPLVMISHGSGGSPMNYRSFALHLARQGYVVAAVMHPQNNFQDNRAEGTDKKWIDRPEHLHQVIDALYHRSEYASMLDSDNIALIGHSAGGYTALVAAGARADLNALDRLCGHPDAQGTVFCLSDQAERPEKTEGTMGMATDKHARATHPRVIQGKNNPAIKALILMAPVGAMFREEGALDEIDIPVLLMHSEQDHELPETLHAGVIRKGLKENPHLEYDVIENGGHYAFITPFPKALQQELGPVASDPDGFDRADFHRQLSLRVDRFLASHLN